MLASARSCGTSSTAWSFSLNAHKWFFTTLDCCYCLWGEGAEPQHGWALPITEAGAEVRGGQPQEPHREPRQHGWALRGARRQGREVRGGGGAQKLRDGVPPAATTTRRPLRRGFRIGDSKIFWQKLTNQFCILYRLDYDASRNRILTQDYAGFWSQTAKRKLMPLTPPKG